MPNFPQKLISVFSILAILTLLAGIVFLPPSAGSARSAAYAAKLETYLLNQMDTYHIPGLAVAIVRDGEVEYLNGLGTANEQGDEVTPDTPFLLASVSKAITALGIMQLVEAGKLNLDDPVQKYLPWFEVNGDGAEKMTVAHLLYQTSGFSEAAGLEANLIPDAADALETGVRDLAAETLLFTPGEDWQYSNLNYNVLGLLIQEISGQTYESYIEDFIFTPLGMSRSYTSLTAARAGGAASGYYPFFGFPLNFDQRMPYTRATLPAGGLWSTAADMSRYMIALLNEGAASGGFILTPQNVARLFEPGFMFDETQGYAMGWTNNNGFMPAEQLVELGSSLQEYGTLSVLFHEGDWVNYKSMVFLIPEVEYGVILLMNSNDPAIPSAFRFFAWDVTLIATGADAQYYPPSEPFILQNFRWLAGLANLLLAGALVWSLVSISKQRRGKTSVVFNQRLILLVGVLPILLAGVLVGYILLKFLPDNNATLPVVLRFAPDAGILILGIMLIAGAWIAANLIFLWLAAKSGGRPEAAP